MNMVLYPAVDDARLAQIRAAAGSMTVLNATTLEEALAAMPEAEAFFGRISPELLAAADRLRWVQSPTASLEHYVFEELVEHPCQLSNMRGLFSDVIADHVMGLVLCAARNLHLYLRQQIAHEWAPIGGESARSGFTHGPAAVNSIDLAHRHLSDCTLGVVGVGHIGREIGRRAAAFDMTVTGVDAEPVGEAPGFSSIDPVEQLPQLLERSDYVVIAAPHTPETYHLFGPEQFRQMRNTAWLINIGRGVIVDLAAVTAALQQGDIAGAALDVFEEEPLPVDHPLWDMPNAILTPHVAAASPRIAERHLETLLENIRRFVAGEELLTPVDKRKWY